MSNAMPPNNSQARLLFPALLGLVLGTALQLQQRELFALSVYLYSGLVALFLWALLIFLKPSIRWRMGVALVALAVLSFSVTGLRATLFLNQSLVPALEGQDVNVVGVVSAMPQHNEAGLRFRFEVESAQVRGQSVSLPPHLHLGWYSGVFGGANTDVPAELQRPPAALEAGERWQLTVRLKAPHGSSNPFGFDFELWLWAQGLQATGYVRTSPKDPAPLRLAQTGQHPVEWLRQRVRDRIFVQVTDRQQAGLIAALVVGDQNAIDRADWDVFRATGVAHLMSISGLHVTMFAWLAALVVGWLWRRSGVLCLWVPAPNAALVCGVLLAAAYATFSGGGLPSQRTVLMLATVGVLRLSGKQWPWPLVWLLACAAVVVVDPWALLQAGFWLSFVAVGVLFATDLGAGQARKQGFRGQFTSNIREQWVITLALTPLTLLLFGQVSVVGLAANALAIPWVTLVVTPLAMAGVVWPLLWQLAALATALMAAYLQLLAALPFASVTLAQAPLWAGAIGVLGGSLLAMPLPWRLRFLGLPLVLPVLLWQAPRPAPGQFELLAADIGQGNALIVTTAQHALVYDAGPRFSRDSDAGHRVLVPLLQALNLRLDRVMISHRDLDHIGGAVAVLTQQPQADLLSSVADDNAIQAVRPAQRCVAGQHWRWDGVDFHVLHPSLADYDPPKKSNAMSCVLRISNGAHTVLLVGDLEKAQELRLVEAGAQLRADVLLVPHHGSKTSSSPEFLDAVQPQIALIQSGYRNRYGHPAAPVLVRYAERQIRVLDSPHCGAFTWQSAQSTQVKCQREDALRYWHHRLP
jgi:competence protein ComEC